MLKSSWVNNMLNSTGAWKGFFKILPDIKKMVSIKSSLNILLKTLFCHWNVQILGTKERHSFCNSAVNIAPCCRTGDPCRASYKNVILWIFAPLWGTWIKYFSPHLCPELRNYYQLLELFLVSAQVVCIYCTWCICEQTLSMKICQQLVTAAGKTRNLEFFLWFWIILMFSAPNESLHCTFKSFSIKCLLCWHPAGAGSTDIYCIASLIRGNLTLLV